MPKINIQLKGVGAELVLGKYMPKDATIFNNWEEFFHYNDVLHVSQLISDHITEMVIEVDNVEVYKGKISPEKFKSQKSISPLLVENSLYLRTECAEQVVYSCSFEADVFESEKLIFEIQDHESLFKVGRSFVSNIRYNDTKYILEWSSAVPIGNICVLCRFENGFLVPIYDAVNKIAKTN